MADRRLAIPVLLLLLAFGLISCSSEKKIERKKQIIPAERLVVKLEANRRKIKTLYASGVLKVNSPQVNSKFNFTVEYKKPDSLKITAYGPFGIDIAQLLLTEDFFNYYDAVGNVLYQGSNDKRISQRIFRIPLGYDELKNLLMGKADFSAVLRKTPDFYALENGAYVLRFTDAESGTVRRYVVAESDLALESFEISNAGEEKIFTAEYSKFQKVKGYRELFPFRIYVESPKNNAELKIEYHSVKINGELNDLRLLLPSDVTVRKL